MYGGDIILEFLICIERVLKSSSSSQRPPSGHETSHLLLHAGYTHPFLLPLASPVYLHFKVAPKVLGPICFYGNYNTYKEHNHTI